MLAPEGLLSTQTQSALPFFSSSSTLVSTCSVFLVFVPKLWGGFLLFLITVGLQLLLKGSHVEGLLSLFFHHGERHMNLYRLHFDGSTDCLSHNVGVGRANGRLIWQLTRLLLGGRVRDL